jgi:hypothetical protein
VTRRRSFASASAAAQAADVTVRWLAADFATAALDPFDLVTAHYPALKQSPDHVVERALFASVAQGGTLLYVGHAPLDRAASLARGFDPNDHVLPHDVKALLPHGWTVEAHEQRPRPGGAPHDRGGWVVTAGDYFGHTAVSCLHSW